MSEPIQEDLHTLEHRAIYDLIANVGWLELYVYDLVEKLGLDINDVRAED